ncbi:heme-binding protein [Neiella marina]|uniref:Heme-binding protein n=1 Tax=Neiella holothuriorum TaxID=2870530 RepID=A0ABS7EJQ8_9GAMM|nr:heme-binding protein [Neiella holothuriorum]MBW8192464.1 heme-binding protein [Neiella holothuriorum]
MNKSIRASVLSVAVTCCSFAASAGSLISNVPVLTLEGAKVIASASAAKAKAENWNVVIVVADANGRVTYLERMDRTSPSSVDVAMKKAETAALYNRDTKVFADRVIGGESTLMTLPDMLPFQGGLPVVVDGTLVGSVGVSGVQGHQDAAIGQAGIDAFMQALNK